MSKPHIILSRPQLGENIGATARIMYNFGLENLRLISPRDGWPNKRAATVSSGGGSLIDNAILCENLKEAIISQTPLRRIANPEDVAGAVLFLASDWSKFITGQTIYVDGGLVMK